MSVKWFLQWNIWLGSCLGLHTLTAKGVGSSPGWGTKIPETMQQGKEKKKKKKKKKHLKHLMDFQKVENETWLLFNFTG